MALYTLDFLLRSPISLRKEWEAEVLIILSVWLCIRFRKVWNLSTVTCTCNALGGRVLCPLSNGKSAWDFHVVCYALLLVLGVGSLMFGIGFVAQADTAGTVETQAVEDPPSGRFTWTIENFSRLNTKKLYSDIFYVGGYKWYLAFSKFP